MRFGIYAEMQNPKKFHKPHAQVYREVMDQVIHADQAGFDSFNVLEHHWFEEFSISTNPQALFAALAQKTQHIRFRTCSHVLPLHQPTVFAGQLAATDILTGGRFEFAIGRGHSWVFPKASIPLEEARQRFMECIDILELAFTQETFSYHGEYYNVDNVSVVPRPIQSPHPKIFTGGASNHNYELAGRKGWGVLITPMLPLEKVLEQLEVYRKVCQEHGHKPEIIFVQALYLDDDGDRARQEAEEYMLQFMLGNTSPTKDMPPRDEMIAKDFGFYATGKLESLATIPYQELVDEEYVWVGSPEEIEKKVEKLIEQCPDLTEIALLCTYAGIEHWKTIRTQELFSHKVMPKFKKKECDKVEEKV